MRSLIIEVLATNERMYDDFIMMKFVGWCKHHGDRYKIPVRVLLSNTKFDHWFRKEWIKQVEKPFLNDNRDFINEMVVAPDEYLELFKTYTDKIINTWPSVLIEQQLKALNNG